MRKTISGKKSRAAALIAGVLLAMSFTGCAENQIPDIPDEQMSEIKDYVAMTLMKYNMGRQSRLVDLSRYSYIDSTPDTLPEESGGMPPVDDTPIINAPEEDEPETSGAQSVQYRLEDILGFPEGVTVAYQGEGFYDSYPQDIEDGGFYMGATDGKKLLVVSFLLSNGTEQDQAIDFGFPETVYRITVNEEYSRKALTTMLPEDMDMLTFDSVLPAAGSTEIVLIIEVDGEMDISTLDLDVQKDSMVYHFRLKQNE